MQHARTRARSLLAFTLIEILVAVGVLVIVIVAVAQIFSSASKVSAVSEANADLIQTANAIESQLRADFRSIPRNSFMVLQQVEVTAADPATGEQEVRADQLGFFSRAGRTTTQYLGSQEGSGGGAEGNILLTWGAESAVARVYYGHGVVASSLPPGTGPTTYRDQNATMVPWKGGAVEIEPWPLGANQPQISNPSIPQLPPANWPLVRLATLLAGDGLPSSPRYASTSDNASVTLFANKAIRLGPLATTYPSGPLPLWTSGRVDVVKWQPDDLFSQMAYQPDTTQSVEALSFIGSNFEAPWSTPSSRLRMIQTLANWAAPTTSGSGGNGASALYLSYPRVEKVPPSAAKADVMLTAPVLAANCSSFKVEWTWADGVGRSYFGEPEPGETPSAESRIGMFVQAGKSQPWFGLNYLAAGNAQNSAVQPASAAPNFLNNEPLGPNDWGWLGAPLIVGATGNMICSVEGPINQEFLAERLPIWKCSPQQGSKRVYQAVFGFNQSDASAVDPVSRGRGPYTPLPSALRVTLRLHDTLGRIEGGREFQFIVDIPAQ